MQCLSRLDGYEKNEDVSMTEYLTYVTNLHSGDLHPVARALSRLSGKTVLHNNCSRRLLYFIPRPLHVSAFTGHHQVEHII
jgi:hypothetical protein